MEIPMPHFSQRRQLSIALLSALALPVTPALAESTAAYPSHPVKLVVPFAAGGSTDLVARVLAEGLRKTLGQPVIVDNRSGAGGMLGTEAVAQAAPDGYTVGIATVSSMTVNPVLYPKAEAVNAKLLPLAQLVTMPSVFMVNPKMGMKDYKGFVAALKADSKQYTAGVQGAGSMGQFLVESLNDTLGVSITSVPYRGSAPALNDALAGVVQVITDQLPSSLSYIKSGKLIPIVVSSNQRAAELPDTPTFKELGYPELNDLGISWFGLVVSAKTPAPIAEKLRAAAAQAVQLPEIQEHLKKMGAAPSTSKPQDFPALISAQLQRNRAIAKRANIKAE
jgi:tripartite-type tricarboxylate transporter receptor subunit TctC